MSGGAVFQQALRFINELRLPEPAHGDAVTALTQGRPGPLAMLYLLGADASLPHEKLMARSASLFIGFCCGNLADDLVDGDCTYLEPASLVGPHLQQLLHNVFFAVAAAAGMPDSVVRAASHDLLFAASEHQREVQTTSWSVDVYCRICNAIAGRQYSGYLKILWHDTALALLAEPFGIGLGEVAHVAEDIRSGDRRFWSMPRDEQQVVVEWARATLARLRSHGLFSVETMAKSVGPILDRVAL